VSDSAKRTVLRHFPYGLFAVTVMSEGEENAMTANWVMQAAFTPPMLVVALENDSKSLPMIRDARGFAVNVLAEGQRELAARLGRSSRHIPYKLQNVPTRAAPATGAPILTEGLGWLECRVVATMPAGDHTLVLGEVLDAGVEREGKPLVLGDAGMKYAG
jgi:flavin reductase (DIM6/NTAB) family NADH-FMN oxidoreductase RutF